MSELDLSSLSGQKFQSTGLQRNYPEGAYFATLNTISVVQPDPHKDPYPRRSLRVTFGFSDIQIAEEGTLVNEKAPVNAQELQLTIESGENFPPLQISLPTIYYGNPEFVQDPADLAAEQGDKKDKLNEMAAQAIRAFWGGWRLYMALGKQIEQSTDIQELMVNFNQIKETGLCKGFLIVRTKPAQGNFLEQQFSQPLGLKDLTDKGKLQINGGQEQRAEPPLT